MQNHTYKEYTIKLYPLAYGYWRAEIYFGQQFISEHRDFSNTFDALLYCENKINQRIK